MRLSSSADLIARAAPASTGQASHAKADRQRTLAAVRGAIRTDRSLAAARWSRRGARTRSDFRGNDRNPKGRDAERLGCATGAGERDPTSGRGPPKTSETESRAYQP